MADALTRAQVTIPLDSGVTKDVLVNTLYFDTDSDYVAVPGDEWIGGIESLLTTFYQAIDGVIFGQNVATPAHVKLYDMRDALPRVPFHEFNIALAPLASGIDLSLPNEVALCLSFKAAGGSGLNMKRRRGRIYLGPIHYAASEMVASQCRPTAAARDAVRDAAAVMAAGYNTAAPADSSVRWAIYSPTTDLTSTLDDAFNDVETGWVDNAFDTQRRRGASPTLRDTF